MPPCPFLRQNWNPASVLLFSLSSGLQQPVVKFAIWGLSSALQLLECGEGEELLVRWLPALIGSEPTFMPASTTQPRGSSARCCFLFSHASYWFLKDWWYLAVSESEHVVCVSRLPGSKSSLLQVHDKNIIRNQITESVARFKFR